MKTKKLAQIARIMRSHHLTIEDLEKFIAHRAEFKALKASPQKDNRFDVLCLVGSKPQRVPFNYRHIGIPLGIFPFKDDPRYIELDETEGKKHSDSDVDESRLLNVEFCEKFNHLRPLLNRYLAILNSPPIEGEYLAQGDYMQDCGWIILFGSCVHSDYYGGSVASKLRYMGRMQ